LLAFLERQLSLPLRLRFPINEQTIYGANEMSDVNCSCLVNQFLASANLSRPFYNKYRITLERAGYKSNRKLMFAIAP
jgi:hypothetical protein